MLNTEQLITTLRPVVNSRLRIMCNVDFDLANIREGVSYHSDFNEFRPVAFNNTPSLEPLHDAKVAQIKRSSKQFLELCRWVCNDSISVRKRIEQWNEGYISSDTTTAPITRVMCAHRPQEFIPWSQPLIDFLHKFGGFNHSGSFAWYYSKVCIELQEVVRALELRNLAELYYYIIHFDPNAKSLTRIVSVVSVAPAEQPDVVATDNPLYEAAIATAQHATDTDDPILAWLKFSADVVVYLRDKEKKHE